MSLCHKAWVFDVDTFQSELAEELFLALKTGEVAVLAAFIDRHRSSLVLPGWPHDPVVADWRERLEEHARETNASVTPSTLGDLAITKYFDCRDERGLGEGFDALISFLRSLPSIGNRAEAIVCGDWFGPRGKRFDPGLMGTGVVSSDFASEYLVLLEGIATASIAPPESPIYRGCYYPPREEDDVRKSRDELIALYRTAVERGRGLMFADFNEAPCRTPGW